ncbi:PEP-CTERM sorting domain-containing protein [Haloferula chungangensis]|uniref:PEP-CTERM sorting domain-containing protein n=1 Tax=Haloferula chungangensis TaxID=1048331 RepID=A0ABW2L3M4_9BACT
MKSFIISAALISTASAVVTVDTNYSNPSAVNGSNDSTQFGYEAFVSMGAGDSWDSVATVGGWSYADLNPAANPNKGWGHAATWFLVELTETTSFSISMDWLPPASGASEEGRPGFSIYAGESIVHEPGQLHGFSNNGNDLSLLNSGWDLNTPSLVFAGNAENFTGDSVTGTFTLDAGRYTIALGNADDSTTSRVDQNYNFTFSTVPEPSSAILMASGCLALISRRRR